MLPDFMAVITTTINKPAVKIFTHQQNKTHFFLGKIMGLLDQVDHICVNYLLHILITDYKSCDLRSGTATCYLWYLKTS